MEQTLLKKSNLENVYSDSYLADQTLDDVQCSTLKVDATTRVKDLTVTGFLNLTGSTNIQGSGGSVNVFSATMNDNGLTTYNLTTNKLQTSSDLTFITSTLSTPNLKIINLTSSSIPYINASKQVTSTNDLTYNSANNQVIIGSNTSSTSKSALEIKSTKGFHLPRLSATDMAALVPHDSTMKGLMCYSSTDDTIYVSNGSTWIKYIPDPFSISLPDNRLLFPTAGVLNSTSDVYWDNVNKCFILNSSMKPAISPSYDNFQCYGSSRFLADMNFTNIDANSARSIWVSGSGNTTFKIDFDTQGSSTQTVALFKNSTQTATSNSLEVYKAGGNVQHTFTNKEAYLCQDDSSCLIGSNTATTSRAALEVKSTTKGLLTPRLASSDITTLQNQCTTVDKGMLIYDTTINALRHYNNSSFVPVGSSYYFRVLAAGNSATTSVPTNVIWSVSTQFNLNWTTPIVASTISGTNYNDRISFPEIGVYLLGGVVAVNTIPYTKACNLGIYSYSSLTSSTTSSSQNLVSISGSSSDKPRPNFAYLLNVTSTSTTYSVFVYQDTGSSQSILSESYIFAYRVA